jgi:hypothetical protein
MKNDEPRDAPDRVEEILGDVLGNNVARVASLPDGTLDTDRDLATLEPMTDAQEARLRVAFGIAPSEAEEDEPVDDEAWRETRARIQAIERAALSPLPEEQAAGLRARFGAGSSDDDDEDDPPR